MLQAPVGCLRQRSELWNSPELPGLGLCRPNLAEARQSDSPFAQFPQSPRTSTTVFSGWNPC